MNDSKLKKAFLLLVSTLLCFVAVFYFSDFFLMLTAKVALSSAKSFLPESGIAVSTAETVETPTETEKEETEAEKTSVKESTEPSTALLTQKTQVQESFTDTPEDILKLIDEAEKTADSDKKDGAIKDYCFTSDGMTDSYGLVKVKNVNKTSIDIKSLLETELDLTVTKDEPSVLIFHTHTTETYQILKRDFYAVGFLSRINDKNQNMVRVGKAVAEEIEKAGYTVIHDTEIHDGTYNGAYAHSRKAVEKYLEEYPSIKIVLDIHRDAIQSSDGTKTAPVAEIGGKKAAQIMIISGCQENGNGVENFPDWKENLVFATALQNKLEELFENITRPLYFSPRKYNMDLTSCSLLVEIGSDGNTLEEAVYTGKCLGVAVSEILEEYEE